VLIARAPTSFRTRNIKKRHITCKKECGVRCLVSCVFDSVRSMEQAWLFHFAADFFQPLDSRFLRIAKLVNCGVSPLGPCEFDCAN